MVSNANWKGFFSKNEFNSDTLNRNTISVDCSKDIVTDVLQDIPAPTSMSELCCGGAWFSSLVVSRAPIKDLLLVDQSENQIKFALANLKKTKPATEGINIQTVSAGIESLENKVADLDLIACTFAAHLLTIDQLELTLEILERSLRKGGSFYLLTIDLEDLRRTVYAQSIEGFWEYEKTRYRDLQIYRDVLSSRKIEFLEERKYESVIYHSTVDEFVKFCLQRPFSTFAALEKELGQQALDERINRVKSMIPLSTRSPFPECLKVTLLRFVRIGN